MRSVSLLFCIALIAACTPRQPEVQSSAVRQAALPDSLSLQRTRCFGSCPTYLVTISRAERVSFESGDTSQIAAAASSALPYLAARAQSIGFYTLPSEILRDPELCLNRATDMPTAIVTIFGPDTTKRVSDYYGCFVGRDLSIPARLAKLRDFEAEIDSVLGTTGFRNRARAR